MAHSRLFYYIEYWAPAGLVLSSLLAFWGILFICMTTFLHLGASYLAMSRIDVDWVGRGRLTKPFVGSKHPIMEGGVANCLPARDGKKLAATVTNGVDATAHREDESFASLTVSAVHPDRLLHMLEQEVDDSEKIYGARGEIAHPTMPTIQGYALVVTRLTWSGKNAQLIRDSAHLIRPSAPCIWPSYVN